METINYKGYVIEIYPDEIPENPRTVWDNLGTIVCNHRRYDFTDKDTEYNVDTIPFKDVISLPLYLLDHSGITMNTTGFDCPWDSGQVGWIYVKKDTAQSEYGDLTPECIEKIKGVLRSEVKTYDHYLTGSVYGYTIKDKDGEEIESLWGFYGDHKESGLLSEAEGIIDRHKTETELNEGVQQKLFN